MFVFALIVIYLVLAAQYESFRDPLIILIALPTALFGALLPLNVGGFLGFASINIYSQIGLVTLIGLISKHGILMVDFANRHAGARAAFAPRARSRRPRRCACVPILMTTAAMVVGMIPLILASGAGARSRFNIGAHHLRRHGDRDAVHPVRDADGLYLPRPRPRRADREGAGGRASGG